MEHHEAAIAVAEERFSSDPSMEAVWSSGRSPGARNGPTRTSTSCWSCRTRSTTDSWLSIAIHSRLAELLSRIVDRSDDAWREAEGAFVSQARLHGGYVLRQAELLGDRLLLHHAAVHLSFAAERAVLARHRVLFAGPKYLDKRLRRAGEAELADRLRELVESPSLDQGSSVLDDLERRGPWPVTREASLSRFVADNELAWSTGRIPPEYR